jgi:hypothetical protein
MSELLNNLLTTEIDIVYYNSAILSERKLNFKIIAFLH